MRTDLPTGTVTFLFTDVEGSTLLLHELGEATYADALATHRRVIREACASHDGVEVDTQGDAFFFAFETAPAAITAAAELTEALSSGPVQVRVGLHTGTPLLSDEGYVGVDVHRAARIAASGHGGQALVSQSTASLADHDLRDLGEHRFKDLLAAERVYQLEGGDFPPLKSLGRTNLPVAAWPLLGRELELAEIRTLVAGRVRLLTLTGAGGSGKTRLALQAAAELSEEFRDGAFFVALAPLLETQAVHSTVAEAVGLQPDDDVRAWLASKRVLLVLDNLEHLPGVAAVVSELMVGNVVVVATSRASLHLSAEREFPVDPLATDAAVELFVSRAAATGRRVATDEAVAAVCRRVDNLPLAIELAAAQTKLLSPAALLERLDAALPLLGNGPVDVPERQRTLRATIDWSHELLDSEAQAAFRRLSVFRGSFTLEAAEAIGGADLDIIAALGDQSLLKPFGDERLFLLETLREYAREQLDKAGETAEYGLRHARWYFDRLEENYRERLGPRRPAAIAWYAAEEDNLRAMLDRLCETAPMEAVRAAYILHPFWIARGAYTEERERFRALEARRDLPPQERAMVLVRLSEVESRLGNVEAAEAADREAASLAKPGSEAYWITLVDLAIHAARRGENDEAVVLAERAVEGARKRDDLSRLNAMGSLSGVLMEVGRTDEARAVLERFIEDARGSGLIVFETLGLVDLARLDLLGAEYESSRAAFTEALRQLRGLGNKMEEIESLKGLGFSLLGLHRRGEARAVFLEVLDHALASSQTYSADVAKALSGIALAADEADAPSAARLYGAVVQLNSAERVHMNAYSQGDGEIERRFVAELAAMLGQDVWEKESTAGASMTLDDAIARARSICGRSSEAVTTAS